MRGKAMMQEMLPAQKGLTVILTPFSYKFWPCLDALFGCFVRHPRGERVKKKRIAVAAAAAAPCGLLQLLGGGLQMLGGLLRLLGDLLLLQSLRGPLLLLLGGLLLGCLRSHTLACACLPARLAFVHPLWPQVPQWANCPRACQLYMQTYKV